MRRSFYGRWIIAASLLTFGISVGLPYYNMPFFYDYYRTAFHWPLHDITLGFPLAALLTLWVGPLVVPRFSQRKLIVAGTLLTFLSFFGFSRMSGDIRAYYFLWFVYTFGYILSGPIPHQIIVSHWYRRNRGMAMGIVYVGVGLVGAAGPWLIKPVTEQYSFRTALLVVGCVMFLAWPFALFVLKDRPAEIGQFPDGALEPTLAPEPEGPTTRIASDLEAVFDVPVQVSAVLGRARMDIGDLLKLGPGTVLELDRKVGEAIDIYVNNRLVARGEVVLVEDKLGVTMTEIIKAERD